MTGEEDKLRVSHKFYATNCTPEPIKCTKTAFICIHVDFTWESIQAQFLFIMRIYLQGSIDQLMTHSLPGSDHYL